MYYKSISKEQARQLAMPLEPFTPNNIESRMDQVFGFGRWSSECSHDLLCAISVPLIGPRGEETQTAISLWLTKNTITIPTEDGELTSRTSYVLAPVASEEDQEANERLAFLNTAYRVLGVGTQGEAKTLSKDDNILFKKMFLSERINDFIVDDTALKVLIAQQEEEEPEEEPSPSSGTNQFEAVQAYITSERQTQEVNFFVLDFSSSGLKIVTSSNFPNDRAFNMSLKTDDNLALWCEVAWKHEIWKNLYHMGINFKRLQLDKFEKLCKYLEIFMPAKVKNMVKTAKTIPVEFDLWKETKRFPAFLYGISSNSISIIYPAFLKTGMRINAKLYPFQKSSPIDCGLIVTSSKLIKGGGSQTTLQILYIDEANSERLESFIRSCVMDDRRSKKLE